MAWADVILVATPMQTKILLFYGMARCAVRGGVGDQLLREIATWQNITPLMQAAKRSKMRELALLLKARADPEM